MDLDSSLRATPHLYLSFLNVYYKYMKHFKTKKIMEIIIINAYCHYALWHVLNKEILSGIYFSTW
jgi:hypothetical protein